MKTIRKEEWNRSFRRGDNFVWYPHEEIVRFVSKHIRKKTDIWQFTELNPGSRILDFGCGIGRHVLFFDEMGLEAWGVDISAEALEKARQWAVAIGRQHLLSRFVLSDGTAPLPFENGYFDFVASHGVLDSMPFVDAKANLVDVWRVLRAGGLFYFDLVSGDDDKHFKEFEGEETVATEHERGTIQTYYNYRRILDLISGVSECRLLEIVFIKRQQLLSKDLNSRFHIVLKKE